MRPRQARTDKNCPASRAASPPARRARNPIPIYFQMTLLARVGGKMRLVGEIHKRRKERGRSILDLAAGSGVRFGEMKRSPIRIGLVLFLLVALPFRAPAPLIYRPGEGWTYELPGGKGDWHRQRAKDQL